jgi:class 3 adenylate cyclase/CHASE2 domain-containing sensor protein
MSLATPHVPFAREDGGRRARALRVGVLVVFALVLGGVAVSPWLRPLERMLVDAEFKLLRSVAPRAVANDVVVVGFDEETMKALPEPLALWHPHLGRFLQAVASAGASIVGLDVVLPDRSYEAIVPGYDRLLLTGILVARRTTPVVLALTVDRAGATRPIHPAFVTAAGPEATGYALLPVDPDGAVRRFDERLGENGTSVATLAGQMARRSGRTVASDGLIDFAAGGPFAFIPLQTVLQWHTAGDSESLARAFRGKAVLLGGTLRFEDRVRAPVNLAGWDAGNDTMPGVLLHAQALRNLLNDGLIRRVPAAVSIVLVLAAALGWFWRAQPTTALCALAAIAVTGLAASTLALASGFELPVANAMVVALVSIGGRQALESTIRFRKRRRLQRAFGGYVSPAVMREIVSGRLNPALGGVKQFGCVLFSDIRDYTGRSERMGPEQTIAFLNAYYTRMVPIIHRHRGTVISFLGDGIMVVFGVPQVQPNPCADALDAARAMLEHLRSLNAELARKGESPLDIGIGLHAGDGIAGHVGSSARHEYTLIGDVTNVASRLQGVTKEVGFRLVCSRAVVERLPDAADLLPLGRHAIKGHTPVEIFAWDPVADPGKVSSTSATRPAQHHALR